MKFAPWSFRSLAGAPEIKMYPWYKNLAMVLVVWLGAMYTIMCLWNGPGTPGHSQPKAVYLAPCSSQCYLSLHARDPLEWQTQLGVGVLWKSCPHAASNACRILWTSAPGWSFLATRSFPTTNGRVWLCPWWPASQWHPFRVATQCALGITKSMRSSVFPLGIEHRYKAPWWVTIFCQFCRISVPSSPEAWSARSIFRFVCFCTFSQPNTVLNIRSSLWASAQSVTCISTNGQSAVTCTSCSKCLLPSTMAESWISAWCTIPKAIPSRMDFTVSRSSQVVTWVRTSATILSCPFWYSNSKLNHARALIHWWPIVSRLGVDIMYMSGLLSIHTANDW